MEPTLSLEEIFARTEKRFNDTTKEIIKFWEDKYFPIIPVSRKPDIYHPVSSKRQYFYVPISDDENLRDDIYVHKAQDVRAIEYRGYDSISELFGNLRVLNYFRKTSIGTVELINGDVKLRLGDWVVWRNELNVQILTKEQFDREFFSPKK